LLARTTMCRPPRESSGGPTSEQSSRMHLRDDAEVHHRRLVYVLVLLLGLLVLYLLIPHDVWETIRTTYFARNVD